VLVVPTYLGSQLWLAGIGLVVVGLCTLASWWFRVARQSPAPSRVGVAAAFGLGLATIAGLAISTREVLGALDAI
jgi:hypothetical protein